jgi:hypothetical protein
MAGVGLISEEVTQMGSNNTSVFYCIIHQVALCCRIFSLEIQDIVDTEILTMDYN